MLLDFLFHCGFFLDVSGIGAGFEDLSVLSFRIVLLSVCGEMLGFMMEFCLEMKTGLSLWVLVFCFFVFFYFILNIFVVVVIDCE